MVPLAFEILSMNGGEGGMTQGSPSSQKAIAIVIALRSHKVDVVSTSIKREKKSAFKQVA